MRSRPNASGRNAMHNRSSRPSGGPSHTDRSILERQNDERISELSNTVNHLKSLTIEIGNEVRDQNSMLDDMGGGFANAQALIGKTMGRIGDMLSSGGGRHMLVMVGFVVGVVVFLYWMIRKGSPS